MKEKITFMFLPAGVFTIKTKVDLRDIKFNLEVNQESCVVLNRKLDRYNAENTNPMFRPNIAYLQRAGSLNPFAIIVESFIWKDDGVYCVGENWLTAKHLLGLSCSPALTTETVSEGATVKIVDRDNAIPSCFGVLKLSDDPTLLPGTKPILDYSIIEL